MAKLKEGVAQITERTITRQPLEKYMINRPVMKARSFPIRRQQVKFIQTLQPAPALTKEQDMLQELFNGERTFGTGQNLPNTDEEILRSGGGLINCGDDGATGEMFGISRRSFGFSGGY